MTKEEIKITLNKLLPKEKEDNINTYVKKLVRHLENIYGFTQFHRWLWAETKKLTNSSKEWADVAQTITGNELIYINGIIALYEKNIIS